MARRRSSRLAGLMVSSTTRTRDQRTAGDSAGSSLVEMGDKRVLKLTMNGERYS